MCTEVENIPGVTGTYDCSGYFGTTCGVPYPEWRHRMRVTWGTPWDVQVSLNWRHTSEVEFDGNSPNPLMTINPPAVNYANMKAMDYFDLAGTWAVRDGTTIRVGVNNILDTDPPIVPYNVDANINGNTYPQTYDALGRTWFIGITADF